MCVAVKFKLYLNGCLVMIVGALLFLNLSSLRAQESVTLPDTIAQRVLACTACHGKEGRAASDGFYPRIAGKPAGYLYNQLVNFRDGRRSYPMMIYMVNHLSDDYLHEIAQYFSELHPPYPAPQVATASAAILAQGQQLVHLGNISKNVPACISCHGQNLTGRAPTIPGLVGLPYDYLNSQLGAWQNGTRRAAKPDCMATIVSRLSGAEMNAALAWLASQPVPEPALPNPASAEKLPMPCGSLPQ